jgi:hypothetical protein
MDCRVAIIKARYYGGIKNSIAVEVVERNRRDWIVKK